MGEKRKTKSLLPNPIKNFAQLQFSQLLVDLRSQLRSTYFNLYYEKLKLENTNRQLGYMNDLLNAYRAVSKRKCFLKDAVRLQSIVIQLNHDKLEINKNILDFEQNLKVLTGVTEEIEPTMSETEAKEALVAQPFGDEEELKSKAPGK